MGSTCSGCWTKSEEVAVEFGSIGPIIYIQLQSLLEVF